MAQANDKPVSSYSRKWLVPGAVLFGAYFTAGLAYFEALGTPGKLFNVLIPVFIIVTGTCVWLALHLFGKGSNAGRRTPLRILLVPAVAFMVCGLLVFLFVAWMDPSRMNSGGLWNVYFNFLLVGLLPVVAALVILHGNLTVRESAEQVQTEARDDAPQKEPLQTLFHLDAVRAGEEFSIPLEDFLFAEAADNYCKLHFLKNGSPRMKMLRITMKELEKSAVQHPGVFRCHRSFLVNARHVSSVQGNAQGYRLKLNAVGETLPVSRSFDIRSLKLQLPDGD